MMSSVLEWLDGKKTYVIGALTMLDVVLHSLANTYPSNAEMMLAVAGLGLAIRHALEKKK